METVEVAPGVHHLRLGIANAYLLGDGGGAVLVDTGPPGSGPEIAAALERLGLRREDVHAVVLTHCHDDHAGSAAEVAGWASARVLAGRDDAPVVAGVRPGPAFDFTDAERALHAVVAADLRPAPPSPVHGELAEGAVLELPGAAGRAVVLEVPGHTPGSVALHLPDLGVLLTGDTIAEHRGDVVLGPFNADRAAAWASLQRLAALDVDAACFGHGEPVPTGASAALRRAVDVFA